MSESVETTVLNIHRAIRDKLEALQYQPFLEDDGGGPYIGLYNPASTNENSDYLCLSLLSGKMEDLGTYRWHFWDNNMNVWMTSELGWEATEEQILAFLQKGLDAVG